MIFVPNFWFAHIWLVPRGMPLGISNAKVRLPSFTLPLSTSVLVVEEEEGVLFPKATVNSSKALMSAFPLASTNI